MISTGFHHIHRLSVSFLSVYVIMSALPRTDTKWWSNNPLSVHTMRNDQVQITQLYEVRNKLRLRCDAKGENASDSLVLLACPLVTTGVCLENCMKPCPIVEGQPDCSVQKRNPITYCHYRVMAPDHVRLDYKVHLGAEEDSGNWWCMFRGQSSDPVVLTYQSPEETSRKTRSPDRVTNKVTTLSTIPSSNQSITAFSSPMPIVEVRSATNATHRSEPKESKMLFVSNMPVEMLIIIIIFVCISVILNVVLFVRCCVVDDYMTKLYRGEPQSPWVHHLFCVDKPKKFANYSRLDHIRMPEPKPPSMALTSSSTFGTMPPNSPVLLQNQFPATATPLYPNSGVTPLLVRNVSAPAAPYEGQPGLELIYDDVNYSTYTTVNPGAKNQIPNVLLPVVSTPDGRTWILDQTGRVYLPCAQPAFTTSGETNTAQTQLAVPLDATTTMQTVNHRIPEYERNELLQRMNLNSAHTLSKRSVTPLPIGTGEQQKRLLQQKQQSRAESTPHLASSANRATSPRNMSTTLQTTLIPSLPVSYAQVRPPAASNLTAVPDHSVIRPLYSASLSTAPNQLSPAQTTTGMTPASDHVQRNPGPLSNPNRLVPPVPHSTAVSLSSTGNPVVDNWVSVQAQRLLNTNTKNYLEEWTLSD